MIKIIRISKVSDFKSIEDLAHIIWHEHYVPIIGIEQVEYMLEKFQSVRTMQKQVKEGAEYFIINTDEKSVGYISFSQKGETLFLSKIYILNEMRGKGIGHSAMKFIEESAIAKDLNKIALTVNKYNTGSIKAYLKMGFINVGEIVSDIGQGYVMDDYKLEKPLKNRKNINSLDKSNN